MYTRMFLLTCLETDWLFRKPPGRFKTFLFSTNPDKTRGSGLDGIGAEKKSFEPTRRFPEQSIGFQTGVYLLRKTQSVHIPDST